MARIVPVNRRRITIFVDRSEDAKATLISLGSLLKKHRLAAGLSREELADRARLSVKTISALEQGARQKPYPDTVAALATALALSAESRTELERAALRRLKPELGRIAALLNLPRVVTPLVDRVDDVKAVFELLEQYRLVTITGSGGIGKTRVAIAVGERQAQQKAMDVAFVDLSPLAYGSLIADTVAAACGARLDGDRAGADALTVYLRDRTLLLILDNCEHLIDDVAEFANKILRTCPGIAILATSRERLDVPGEAVFRLPSLTFPQDRAKAASADSYSAVKLFVERAKAIDSRFGVSDENVSLIADICRRVDGIPLAIELAAARLPVLGLSTLRARLDERFMLVAPVRGVPSRQTTMYATISWSYSLLAPAERALLNRLGIFVDGFTLEAAEHVCAGGLLAFTDIASVLSSLVDKSLVNIALNVDPPRYRLLDSVRAFALEQLTIEAGREFVARRHAAWVVDLALVFAQSRDVGTADIASTLSELGNIRAALQWGLDSKDDEDTIAAARIAGTLRNLWLATSKREECRFWIESLIERIDEAKFPEVVSLLWAGLVQAMRGTAAVRALAERALPVVERSGDYAKGMHLRAEVALDYHGRGEDAQAETVLNESLRIGDAHHVEEATAYVHILGMLAVIRLPHRSEEARAYLAQAFQIVPSHARPWRRWLMDILAGIEFSKGNLSSALEIVEDANRQFADPGADRASIYADLGGYNLLANNLDTAERFAREIVVRWHESPEAPPAIEQLATILALRGDAATGAKLLGFVDEWRERNKFVPTPLEYSTHDLLVRTLQARLSETVIDRLKNEGRALALGQAIDCALAELDSTH